MATSVYTPIPSPLYPKPKTKCRPIATTAAVPTDRRPNVISGPSGAGTGTLIKRLFDAHPDTFVLTVSHTTRMPRAGETEGETYFFVSPSVFSSLISQDAFVEHAFFSGHHYGTSKRTIAGEAAKGLVVVLDIETEGVKQMKANRSIDARYVFIKSPSLTVLEAPLRSRGTETEEDIQKRLARVKVELEYAATPGVHDRININDDLEKAYEELAEFAYRLSVSGQER